MKAGEWQQELMNYDPATGEAKPYPSHAQQWREYHGYMTAWLFNPWTGERRDARDIGSDVLGRLCEPRAAPFRHEKILMPATAGLSAGINVMPENTGTANQAQVVDRRRR